MAVSRNKKIVVAILAVGAALSLAACSGGGADGSTLFGGATPTPTPASPPGSAPTPAPTPIPTAPPSLPGNAQHATLSVDCSGANCGATSPNTVIAGAAGTWTYTNTTGNAEAVDVSITGAAGRTGNLIISNTTANSLTMYNVPNTLSSQRMALPTAAQLAAEAAVSTPRPVVPPPNRIPAAVRNFVPPRLSEAQASRQLIRVNQRVAYNVGDARNWFDSDNATHATKLIRQLNTADNRQVNIWVENSEYSASGDPTKVTPNDIDRFGSAFATGAGNVAITSIYSMDTSLLGQPWGALPANSSSNGLIPATEPIDIVIINITPDGKPFGEIGYFYPLNNYLNSSLAVGKQFSNEALAFFMDSETIYNARTGYVVAGVDFELSTLAHEFTHMINFYQRDILLGDAYTNDSWLEEMTAMGMEDIVDSQINAAYNAVRDARFPDWLKQGGYNCSLNVYNSDIEDPCFSYSVGGSFMGYLLRQYGVANFYQKLGSDSSSTVSLTRLDNVIRSAAALTPGTPANLADALRHWHASVSLFSALPPAGYGYPARAESIGSGVNAMTYNLPTVASNSFFVGYRDEGFPFVTPGQLLPNAMYPVLRKNLPNTWTESVALPAGASLTVVIQ